MMGWSQSQKGHYGWLIREALVDVMSGQEILCLLASCVLSVMLARHAEETWINEKSRQTYRRDKTDHCRKTSGNIPINARFRFPDILDMIKISQGGTADSRAMTPNNLYPGLKVQGVHCVSSL